jgi:hypothetical protein
MKTAPWLTRLGLLLPLALAGCGENAADRGKPRGKAAKGTSTGSRVADAEIQANLAKLDPEDRRLAEAQRLCAVEDENPLGSMGTPYELTVKGEPVFLCCKGCQRKALADPDKTLAKVRELSAKNAVPPKK